MIMNKIQRYSPIIKQVPQKSKTQNRKGTESALLACPLGSAQVGLVKPAQAESLLACLVEVLLACCIVKIEKVLEMLC